MKVLLLTFYIKSVGVNFEHVYQARDKSPVNLCGSVRSGYSPKHCINGITSGGGLPASFMRPINFGFSFLISKQYGATLFLFELLNLATPISTI